MPKTLYICYFGIREPLVQTQVIAYLREIMKDGVSVSLLTFEPQNFVDAEEAELRGRLTKIGIDWHWLTYHKRPSAPATLYDILNGARLVRKLINSENFDVLHCRIHVPATMAAIARKLSRKKPKMLFDIRGFFPEEYVDAGVWPQDGWLFRAAKRIEKWLMSESDAFVVLTEKARDILFPESRETGLDSKGRPVEVIPCCVDNSLFLADDDAVRSELRRELGIGSKRFVLVYVGSFGGWYLSDEMFEMFAAARAADASVFVMILTQRQPELAIERLRQAGFADSDFLVKSVAPDEIPKYLNAADAGVSFIKRCYSKQSSSPTKNAEYLAAGLSFIANSGIGDVDEVIEQDNVGVVIKNFNTAEYLSAVNAIKNLGDVRDRCRTSARTRFDLQAVGGVSYRRLYKRLLGKSLP